MSNILLPSLEILNYRSFQELRIKRLGRVNLITGKNSIGKTSLLEALYLYSNRADPASVRRVLMRRNELRAEDGSTRLSAHTLKPNEDENDDRLRGIDWLASLKNLFYGRPALDESQSYFVIQDGLAQSLSVRCGTPNFEEYRSIYHGYGYRSEEEVTFARLSRGSVSHIHKDVATEMPLSGFSWDSVVSVWNRIILTADEDAVLDSLRIIAPDVRRLAFTVEGNIPQPIVRLRGQSEPVSLDSLGEGTARMLALSLALVNSQNGFLLIDEIGTGLHYTVHEQMWYLIFTIAARLNIQVFATTHSADCAEAFARVANAHQEEGLLLRLYRSKSGDVKATTFEEEDLEVVAQHKVEVR